MTTFYFQYCMIYCPFSSKKSLKRRIDEVDPYAKPKDLLEVSPKGLVPALKFNKFNPPRSLNESTVILEYLNEYVRASKSINTILDGNLF